MGPWHCHLPSMVRVALGTATSLMRPEHPSAWGHRDQGGRDEEKGWPWGRGQGDKVTLGLGWPWGGDQRTWQPWGWEEGDKVALGWGHKDVRCWGQQEEDVLGWPWGGGKGS